MDKESIQERILQWQLLADQFYKEDARVFIKELNGNIHFCKIILVGETKVTIDNYDPEQRAGTRDYIDWLSIAKFERVKEVEDEV